MAWAIVRFIARTAPITLEVFLHRNFGARTGKQLVQGAFLVAVVAGILKVAKVPSLFPHFFLAYGLLAVRHWNISQRRPVTTEFHSYRTGEPLAYWARLPLYQPMIQPYVEPLFCCYIALFCSFFDPILCRWIIFSTVALFIKEQIFLHEIRTRRLDAMDNRIDSGRVAPRTNPDGEAFVEARPAPPRARPQQPRRQPPPPRRN